MSSEPMAPCVWDGSALDGMHWVHSDDNTSNELPHGAPEHLRLSPEEELECPSRCLEALLYHHEVVYHIYPLHPCAPSPSHLIRNHIYRRDPMTLPMFHLVPPILG